jgi:hypothetical protein
MSRRLIGGGKVKGFPGAKAKASLNRALHQSIDDLMNKSLLMDPNPGDLTTARMKLG